MMISIIFVVVTTLIALFDAFLIIKFKLSLEYLLLVEILSGQLLIRIILLLIEVSRQLLVFEHWVVLCWRFFAR